MSNKTYKNMLIINLFIDILIIIILNIISKLSMCEKLMFSLSMFGMGIFCSVSFSIFFYIVYQYIELIFKIFTMFFLIGSFIGMINICINLFENDPIILSIIIPVINLFILTLYIRIYVWKINRNEYIENKRQKKINKIIKK